MFFPHKGVEGSPGKLLGDDWLEPRDDDEVSDVLVVGKSLLIGQLPGLVASGVQLLCSTFPVSDEGVIPLRKPHLLINTHRMVEEGDTGCS